MCAVSNGRRVTADTTGFRNVVDKRDATLNILPLCGKLLSTSVGGQKMMFNFVVNFKINENHK